MSKFEVKSIATFFKPNGSFARRNITTEIESERTADVLMQPVFSEQIVELIEEDLNKQGRRTMGDTEIISIKLKK